MAYSNPVARLIIHYLSDFNTHVLNRFSVDALHYAWCTVKLEAVVDSAGLAAGTVAVRSSVAVFASDDTSAAFNEDSVAFNTLCDCVQR